MGHVVELLVSMFCQECGPGRLWFSAPGGLAPPGVRHAADFEIRAEGAQRGGSPNPRAPSARHTLEYGVGPRKQRSPKTNIKGVERFSQPVRERRPRGLCGSLYRRLLRWSTAASEARHSMRVSAVGSHQGLGLGLQCYSGPGLLPELVGLGLSLSAPVDAN